MVENRSDRADLPKVSVLLSRQIFSSRQNFFGHKKAQEAQRGTAATDACSVPVEVVGCTLQVDGVAPCASLHEAQP